MAAIKQKAGVGACFACGEALVWRKTDGGALSCFCQHCDFQGFAKHGTQAERLILSKLSDRPQPAPAVVQPAPAAPGAVESQPAPAAKPAARKTEVKPLPKPGIFGGLIG